MGPPRMWKSGPESFQVIILDPKLPGEDGLYLLQRLRGNGLDTPVLVLTARTGLAEKIRALHLGADDFMSMPFDLDDLLERLGALGRPAHCRLEIAEILEKGAASMRKTRYDLLMFGILLAFTLVTWGCGTNSTNTSPTKGSSGRQARVSCPRRDHRKLAGPGPEGKNSVQEANRPGGQAVRVVRMGVVQADSVSAFLNPARSCRRLSRDS